MYLPRQQIAQLYSDLIRTNRHGSAPIVILTALTVDSLCAAHILDLLLKRDFVRHQLVPIAGYSDLQKAGIQQVQTLSLARGGSGGTVVCLGLGGAVALEEVLGLDGGAEDAEDGAAEDHGVEVWVLDSHRPLNLDNVFGISAASRGPTTRPGVVEGRVLPTYKPGRGGVIVFDDGDLEEELRAEKEAFFALQDMPEITEEDLALDDDETEIQDDGDTEQPGDDDEEAASSGQKRKRASSLGGSEDEDEDSDGEASRARRRRRSNSSSSIPIPSSPGGNPLSAQLDADSTPPPMPSSPPKKKEPSAKQLRKELLRLRRKHEATLDRYYDLGTKAAECVSSMLYSLASELGRGENELLWLAIVGISSMTTSASGPGARASQIKQVLQDEVRRLNHIPEAELQRSQSTEAIIPTTARSATDNSIRLSPEPRFLMIRHWSLYDSMLHSPYLATRLHVWSEPGKKRLHKLLAKMGISLQEAGKGYLHMDSELKRTLRKRILKFAEQYNLDGLVPTDKGRGDMEGWGFVRSWGWSGTLSAEDVAIVIGAILEVGGEHEMLPGLLTPASARGHSSDATYNDRVRNLPTPPHSSDDGNENDGTANDIPDYVEMRFSRALAALKPSKGLNVILENLPAAMGLYRAILRVGSALMSKQSMRHLKTFRIGVVKEGPDVQLFTHPGALVRLAGWVAEAVAVLEGEQGRRPEKSCDALVLAALDEGRGVYVVVGLGGGTGWNSSGGTKIRSKAEAKEREERKKRKAAERAARKAEEGRKREERRRLRKERNAANGMLDEDDEEESELETESEEESEDDSEDEEDEEMTGGMRKKHRGLNRFGQAFQEVVEETGSRVRIDSFEHSVVEVKKDDFTGFLEVLSTKPVVG